MTRRYTGSAELYSGLSSCLDDEVLSVDTYCCRILHGSFSWLATLFSNTLTLGMSDPIEHWWSIIKTHKATYILQFRGKLNGDGGTIQMRQGDDWACELAGLGEAGRDEDTPVWKNGSYSGKVDGKKTLGDVIDIVNNMNAYYSLMSNNCQDLCKRVYKNLC